MRSPAGLRDAAAHDDRAVPCLAHHDGADGWVRPGAPEIAVTQRQGFAHEAPIERGIVRRILRQRRGGATFRECHPPRATPRAGAPSSAVSSPMMSSKSFASRKFRYTDAKRT